MDLQKCTSFKDMSSISMTPSSLLNKVHAKARFEEHERAADHAVIKDVDIDLREVYFLIMHFLSSGPCQRSFGQFWNELLEHQLLPRRYHAWYSRSGVLSGDENDDGISCPLTYDKLVERNHHVDKDHLVKLLRQLMLGSASPLEGMVRRSVPSASDVPTLLGSGSFSLLDVDRNKLNEQVRHLPAHLRWPHMQADQVRGLGLREIGGGFSKHHRAPSIRFACYAIAKPSTMVQKMQNIKKLRGHRNAVYCAIFDRSGRYVITGSDDRLVKIWSMEIAFCLASCRGHEGDITDLAVSSNNVVVASASNDYSIRVWRLPDGYPIAVLRGHIGAVTAIAFSPRTNSAYQLLSSSDDGTCRIWDARNSQHRPRIYLPKPTDTIAGKSNGPSSSNGPQCHQILCCAYNANGTVFVTGSSDTFARVWSAAYRFNADDSEQPNHEIDLLGGHENDVNYVQFSGSAVVSRSSTSDSYTEENIPKFRNSWFSHDNIVTCSRDGSAIIWIPRSRRSHGKVGRWTRAYHLKVPPPPMPPQPPRGGPRQRLLPTPRGVNMIVWSLDNRFVLAAIMDCRICVWNASDGSLVHSLTGHSESTYVLDVHPFNPRIAMSAGYDGKTIVWDIWEGTPIRVYEIGRFKLVDGKFSPDGTSIVLSDDVGQTYLLNTGQGESQKDAKYDQFFLGDYRPLVPDPLGHAPGEVLDQETQLVPYKRNLQDPLCDSSMIPYPEPYQSMYQKRRLGALGIEWRPSSIKFAIGPDIGLGQDYPILPLEDLDVVIEPMPEFLDPMFWEPENEAINDDTDSEYNVTEESLSEAKQEGLSESSSSDPECSSENNKLETRDRDVLRRSKRKKSEADVELMTSSGRRVRRRNLDERDSTPSGSKRIKKSKQKNSKRKSSKMKLLRPRRVAAQSSVNLFSQIRGTLSDGEEEGGGSEDDSSDAESQLQDSNAESSEQKEKYSKGKQSSLDSEVVIKPPQFLESLETVEPRRRLVLKFSIRNSQKSVTSENTHDQADLVSSSRPTQETSMENRINLCSDAQGSSSANVIDDPSENQNRTYSGDREKEHENLDGDLDTSADNNESKVRWGEVKVRTSKRMKSDVLLTEHYTSFDVQDTNKNEISNCLKPRIEYGRSSPGVEIQSYGDKEQIGTGTLENVHCATSPGYAHGSSLCDLSSLVNENLSEGEKDLVAGTNHSHELKDNLPPKPTKLRIKSKSILGDPKGPLKVKFFTSAGDGDSVSESPSCLENSLVFRLPEDDERFALPSSSQKYDSLTEMDDSVSRTVKSNRDRSSLDGYGGDIELNHDTEYNFPETSTDEIRRTRSMRLKTTSRETSNYKIREGRKSVGTSRSAEKSTKEAFDEDQTEEWMPSSKMTVRSRSTRQKEGGNYSNYQSSSLGRRSSYASRKSNWLMLSEKEKGGYRYIPQLGDEVVYLRQGHQGYIESSGSSPAGPWITITGHIRAAEICEVEGLDYATLPGSGESCCKLTLKFMDNSASVFGKRFKLTLPELIDFPDFIVERTRYDAVVKRNWTLRDKCEVWWRDERVDGGGEWWSGRIVSLKDKSSDFPGSPWERYWIQYKGDQDSQPHCPWELHDRASPWERPSIDSEVRDTLLHSFTGLEQSAGRNQDKHGILKLNQIAQKPDFMNRFPVPLSPDVIKLRLEHDYYRSLKALNHDITVMQSNAESYFGKNIEIAMKMKRLSGWFDRTLSKL